MAKPALKTLFSIITGLQITEETLNEVTEISAVMTEGDDFLTAAVRAECERIIPQIHLVRPEDAADTYMFLKTHFIEPMM